MEWQLVLVIVVVAPIVLFVPFLVWAMAASGLFLVIRDSLRRRSRTARRMAFRKATQTVRPG